MKVIISVGCYGILRAQVDSQNSKRLYFWMMFVFFLIATMNTWTITGKDLKTLYIEGIKGRLTRVSIQTEDSITTLTARVLSPPPAPYAPQEEKVFKYRISHPDDTLLMDWVESPKNRVIIVTKEGNVVPIDELMPYMTVKHQVGRVMLVQAPLSFLLTPFLGLWLGFIVSNRNGQVMDLWDALPRWKSRTLPVRGDNEMAFVFGISYQRGMRKPLKSNRWKKSFNAISTSGEMWSYINHLLSGGYRLDLFHTWLAEEDKFKNPVTITELRGFLFEVLGSIVPVHRPDFRFSLFAGEGFGIGHFSYSEWKTESDSLAHEEGPSLILSLSFGGSIWVRLPNSPYLAIFEVSNRFRSDSYESTDIQLGVGYVF